MEILFGLLVVNLLLSCIVGWVSQQRGRGFALGFWLSAFLSPLFGVVILIALPESESGKPRAKASSMSRVAAAEWARVGHSLNVLDYDDFVQAVPGTEEAILATKQKRMLQGWQAINHEDGLAIGQFMQRPLFPALAQEIRRVIEMNAYHSASCSALLGRLIAEEQRKAEEQKQLAHDAEVENEAERLRAREREKRNAANNRRILLGALAVTALVTLTFFGASKLQDITFQRKIDDMKLECAQLEAQANTTEDQYTKLVAPFNETLAQLNREKSNLDSRWRQRILAEELGLREQAEAKVTARLRDRGYYYDVTVTNNSDYCVWRAQRGSFSDGPESAVVTLFQGTTNLREARPSQWDVENAEDQYGFSMGCVIPSGKSISFQVAYAEFSTPQSKRDAELRGIRFRGPDFMGDYQYVVDRVTPTNLHFFELSSRASGNEVIWTASPVEWSALATKRLVNEDADRLAELPKQVLKLERDVEALPINAALAEAKIGAAQCRAELSDLIRPQTSSVAR